MGFFAQMQVNLLFKPDYVISVVDAQQKPIALHLSQLPDLHRPVQSSFHLAVCMWWLCDKMRLSMCNKT